MRYQSLRRRERHFKTFTGMSPEEFDLLAAQLRPVWEQARAKRLEHRKRRRSMGAGRKFALPTFEDKLLLMLVWAKLYPTHVLLEYLFGVDESTVCRTLRSIARLSKGRFPLDRRGKKITTVEELKVLVPDLDDVLMDATEQPVLRPVRKQTRKQYHSGKRCIYSVKTQVATTPAGRTLHVSESVGARMHDLTLLRHSDLLRQLPAGLPVYGDAGYDGIAKDYPEHLFRLPFRRFRMKPLLSRAETHANHVQRCRRTPVEHVLSRLKKYSVLSQCYRNAKHSYGAIFRFVALIVDFRAALRLSVA
jgi:hypothetical protein